MDSYLQFCIKFRSSASFFLMLNVSCRILYKDLFLFPARLTLRHFIPDCDGMSNRYSSRKFTDEKYISIGVSSSLLKLSLQSQISDDRQLSQYESLLLINSFPGSVSKRDSGIFFYTIRKRYSCRELLGSAFIILRGSVDRFF